jgi:hypothetical protein
MQVLRRFRGSAVGLKSLVLLCAGRVEVIPHPGTRANFTVCAADPLFKAPGLLHIASSLGLCGLTPAAARRHLLEGNRSEYADP